MAYRQLCAVTLVALGMVASACGGGVASGQSGGSPETQPPANADQPPGSSSDQAPTNGDQAPTSSDAPPGSSDDTAGTGGSGKAGALCQQVCKQVEMLANDCSGRMGAVSTLCSDKVDCQVPPNFPCTTEAVDFLGCFLENIGQICKAAAPIDGSGGTDALPQQPPQGNNGNQCGDVTKKFTDCIEKNHVDTNTMQPDPQDTTCESGVGCDGCPSALTKCVCEAGDDFDKLMMCQTP